MQTNINSTDKKSLWSAVWGMALCAFVLIASEFMPVAFLTLMSNDLSITTGQAGQSISISGIFAFFTSLFLGSIIGNMNRKKAILLFVFFMLISGLIVTFAPNQTILLLGRAILGISVGGFWSMQTAVILKIVNEKEVPKALALMNGGNALATMLAAPLGSYLGGVIGWRGAFFIIVPFAIITFIWQYKALPNLPIQEKTSRKSNVFSAFKVLKKKIVSMGILAIIFLFMGQFALFSYIRPYLETVINVNYQQLTILLFTMGIAGLIGNMIVGNLLKRTLYLLLILFPFLMMVVALLFIFINHSFLNMLVLMFLWGFLGTSLPTVWWTWLSKTLIGDEVEAGGGLMVAVIQLAITIGAFFGGILYDILGFVATFLFSALILFLCSLMAYITRAEYRRSRLIEDLTL
ncbi:major facilitator superfamily transporter [Aliarcobacter faecis]|uniref:MFS transporter n=1 Tax=Aliarcobacter faecis TaxID=1564138 RepID=UPI0004B74766|nr:MFS transporter [Aliarcobacter faecis]QKF73629.1 major facilitator superfamily transporter [Aliarcobacter faecis]